MSYEKQLYTLNCQDHFILYSPNYVYGLARMCLNSSSIYMNDTKKYVVYRDKNAEELEAYYKQKFAESSERLVV